MPKKETRSVIQITIATLLAILACQTAGAVEYIRQESPQPGTAVELESPIEYAFTDRPLSDRFLWKSAKEALKDKPDFWRDATFIFDFRNYYFSRENAPINEPEAYVLGGVLGLQSGWWKNFGVRLAYYNSTKISASGPDTGLLAPGQKNINVLGEANLRFRITDSALAGSEIVLYRQTLALPFVNKHDIRQVPAAHEGYTISRTNSDLDYFVGHITKFKDYYSNDFIHMSEAAGALDTDKGLTIIGAKFAPTEKSSLGAAYYKGWDTFDTFFTEASAAFILTSGIDLKVSAQFTDQSSSGDELVGDFDTHQFAVIAASSWKGAVISLGASKTNDSAGIRKPWGGTPSYMSIQRYDFDRANEEAYKFGLSYNTDYFSDLGLSSFAAIVHGRNARNPITGESLPDRTEYDITVDYKPPGGFLEGLWLRVRYNYIDIEGAGVDANDFRLILNYSLPFL